MQDAEVVLSAKYIPADEGVVSIIEEGKINSYVFIAPEVDE